jgi:hypothetical protein
MKTNISSGVDHMKSLTSKKLRSIILETLSSLNENENLDDVDYVSDIKSKSTKEKVAAIQQMINVQLDIGLEADGVWGDNTNKGWARWLEVNQKDMPEGVDIKLAGTDWKNNHGVFEPNINGILDFINKIMNNQLKASDLKAKQLKQKQKDATQTAQTAGQKFEKDFKEKEKEKKKQGGPAKKFRQVEGFLVPFSVPPSKIGELGATTQMGSGIVQLNRPKQTGGLKTNEFKAYTAESLLSQIDSPKLKNAMIAQAKKQSFGGMQWTRTFVSLGTNKGFDLTTDNEYKLYAIFVPDENPESVVSGVFYIGYFSRKGVNDAVPLIKITGLKYSPKQGIFLEQGESKKASGDAVAQKESLTRLNIRNLILQEIRKIGEL